MIATGLQEVCISGPPPPGGGSLPLEAVPDAREREKRVKGVSKSGVGAEREKGVKNAKNGRKGYPNRYMIKILAMRSNVERVGDLRQRVH